MYIPIYLEIDDDKNPIYKAAFLKDIEKLYGNKVIIATSEYVELVENLDKLVVIPDDIINKIDSLNVNAGSRGMLLELQKNDELRDWLKSSIKVEDTDGFIVNGLYNFVYQASKDLDVNIVFSADKLLSEKIRLDEYATNLESKNAKVSELEEKTVEMQRQIDAKNENLQRLQQKITDLSTELFKNNAEKQYIDEQMELNEQRMDKSEKQKVLLSDLYASVLKELNETKTELLNLKNRGA